MISVQKYYYYYYNRDFLIIKFDDMFFCAYLPSISIICMYVIHLIIVTTNVKHSRDGIILVCMS